MKKYLVLAMALVLTGCGSSDSDSGTDITILNSSGFPAVSGLYAFNTSDIIETCTGSQPNNFGRLAQNVRVTQSLNEITLSPTDDNVVPGLTITSQTPMSGTISRNGTFIANRSVTGITANGFQTNIQYTLEGLFRSTSWSGTVRYTGTFPGFPDVCQGNATFSGPLVQSDVISVVAPDNDGPQPEILEPQQEPQQLAPQPEPPPDDPQPVPIPEPQQPTPDPQPEPEQPEPAPEPVAQPEPEPQEYDAGYACFSYANATNVWNWTFDRAGLLDENQVQVGHWGHTGPYSYKVFPDQFPAVTVNERQDRTLSLHDDTGFEWGSCDLTPLSSIPRADTFIACAGPDSYFSFALADDNTVRAVQWNLGTNTTLQFDYNDYDRVLDADQYDDNYRIIGTDLGISFDPFEGPNFAILMDGQTRYPCQHAQHR